MIYKHKSTKLDSSQYSYQSFVYTQLNGLTVLFQTIQFSKSHLFALSLNVNFCLTYSSDPIRCYHSEPEWTLEQW